VDITDGKVTLNGTVSEINEFYIANRIAWFTRGVREVENLIRVVA
jgi:Putative phospholipid-binding domain.